MDSAYIVKILGFLTWRVAIAATPHNLLPILPREDLLLKYLVQAAVIVQAGQVSRPLRRCFPELDLVRPELITHAALLLASVAPRLVEDIHADRLVGPDIRTCQVDFAVHLGIKLRRLLRAGHLLVVRSLAFELDRLDSLIDRHFLHLALVRFQLRCLVQLRVLGRGLFEYISCTLAGRLLSDLSSIHLHILHPSIEEVCCSLLIGPTHSRR